jgi:hypothetical protein
LYLFGRNGMQDPRFARGAASANARESSRGGVLLNAAQSAL